MEVSVHEGRRVCIKEMSPDKAKMCVQSRLIRPTFKKVQVVYYLSRNGRLEHPHYMEVTHLAHQQLRLKDVLERLTVLRGKGMPSLYSWSCKRSYKNGYVWNDLAHNDVIYPSEGAECVLKGSELVVDCTEKLHHLQVGNNVQEFQLGNHHQAGQDSNIKPKRKCLASKRQAQHPEMLNRHHHTEANVEEEEEEYEDKTLYTRCSMDVPREANEEFKQKKPPQNKNNSTPTELNLDSNSSFSSPPSTTSPTLSDNSNTENNLNDNNNNNNINSLKRFEDGDAVGNEPMLSRNSMLFSLIACGGSGSFRKTVPPSPPPPCTAVRKSGGLHKGVVCKAAKMAAAVEEEADVMIRYMSENPRFGNFQSEEKEYFSGSIVESITTEERLGDAEHRLKKSSSYNHERSTKAGLGEAAAEEVKKDKGMKGKCIPRKKSSSKNPKK